MKALYFVSYEVKTVNFKIREMCQLELDKPVRSFGDILNMANTIKENYEKSIGECVVTILNYKRLEEETVFSDPNQQDPGAEQMVAEQIGVEQ